MKDTTKTLTVVGATGTLAVPVIRRLLSHGVAVTAVARNLDKAAALLPVDNERLKIVYGDVEDVASLDAAFAGSEHIYITLNTTSLNPELPFHTEREGVMNIVESAKRNGVSQLMQIVGIDSLHEEFAVKGMVYETNPIRRPGMDAIKDSGIPYTFFHCSFFLDSFPVFIQDDTFAIIGDYKYPIYYTNTSDLALHIYNAIGNSTAFNKAYAVQGKEGMTLPEAAAEFLRVYDPKIGIAVMPIAAISEMGMPPQEAVFMEHMLSYVEQLREEPVSQATWEDLGAPATGIEAFARSLREQQA